jgi:hypothetical protein
VLLGVSVPARQQLHVLHFQGGRTAITSSVAFPRRYVNLLITYFFLLSIYLVVLMCVCVCMQMWLLGVSVPAR